MRVSFNPNIFTVKKYNNNLVANTITQNFSKQNINDVFVRTTQPIAFTGVNGKQFNKESITKIFDKTYDKILEESKKDNPFLENIGIQKPKLSYDEENCPTQIAAYSPQDNTIYFNAKTFEQFNNELSTVMFKDENGQISFYKKFLNQNQINELMQQAKNAGIEAKQYTLSEKDKELYVESFFAHEMRHCIQTQFELSTENIGETAQKSFVRKKEMIDFYKEIGFISEDNPQFAISFDFILNYKPKVNLPEDTKFASSGTYNGEKIYWNAKDFTEEGQANEGDTLAYYIRPHEIDAYKFECDYVENKVRQNPNIYSEDFLSFYLSEKKPRYEKGLELRALLQ